MTIWRSTASTIGGLLAAGLIIAGVEFLAHESITGDGLFVSAATGYGLGAVVGCFVAARWGARWSALIVIGVLTALAVVNLFAFPHPLWFIPLAGVALAGGATAGYALSRRLHTRGKID